MRILPYVMSAIMLTSHSYGQNRSRNTPFKAVDTSSVTIYYSKELTFYDLKKNGFGLDAVRISAPKSKKTNTVTLIADDVQDSSIIKESILPYETAKVVSRQSREFEKYSKIYEEIAKSDAVGR